MAFRRNQLASLMDRAGITRAMLAARALALFPRRWLTVLTYHRVAAPGAAGYDPDVVDATPDAFEGQVRLLQQYFTLVDMADLEEWQAGGPLPTNPAMITFDDGYRDNHDVVLPILRRLGAKAVFFIATGYVSDRRVFWWERIHQLVAGCTRARISLRYPSAVELPMGTPQARRQAAKALLRQVKSEPGLDLERFLEELGAACGSTQGLDEERRLAEALVLTWDQVRALRDAGMDVQSHSHGHRVLTTLEPAEASRDLLRARRELEAALDRPIRAVAYPTGRPLGASPAMRAAVTDAGYTFGFTVERLVPIERQTDWLRIPRMMVDGAASEAFFKGCLAFPPLAYPGN